MASSANAKIVTAVEEIDPKLAADYLLKNKNNRPVRKADVQFLVGEMKREWQLTHEGIAFDTEGNLFDGQNRLHAIILSGRTIRILVTRGVPVRAREVVNRGRSRSAADNLMISTGDSKYTSYYTGILNALRKYAVVRDGDSPRQMSVGEARAIEKKFATALAALSRFFVVSYRTRGISRAAIIAGFVMAHIENPAKIEDALEKYLTGEDLHAGSPILLLRNRMLASEGRASSGEDEFRATLFALATYLDGTTRSRIQIGAKGTLENSPVFQRFVDANNKPAK